MPESIYVLTNQVMPGIVKIGRTSGRVEDRMRQLDTTGIPLPFECFSAWEVKDAMIAEKALHVAFGDHRLRDKREFFRISPDKPTAILKAFGSRNVTPGGEVVEDEDDLKSLEKARSRRPNFNFDMIGLKPGAELESVFDPEVKCTVESRKKVNFRGEVMSLSAAALVVAHENGRNWVSVAGPVFWKYEDQPLSEWRSEADDVDDD